jgi:hypothetical protein
LDRKLADKSEPDDNARFTQLDLGNADPLQGDGADGHERRVIQADLVRHADAQIARDRDDLGVVCLTGACAGHAISHGKGIAGALANIQNDTRAAIPEWNCHIQPAADCVYGGGNAVTRGFIDDLFDEILAVERCTNKIGTAGFDDHALGTGTDQRPPVLDQYAPLRRNRCRHLHHARGA